MGKDEETLVVGVRRVRLDLHLVLLEKVPIVAVLETSLHEDAIKVGGKVLTAYDLPNKVHLGLEVCLCAQLATQLLHLFDLLLLEILQGLLLALRHRVPGGSATIVIVEAGGRPETSIPIVQLAESILLHLLLVILTHVVAATVLHFFLWSVSCLF